MVNFRIEFPSSDDVVLVLFSVIIADMCKSFLKNSVLHLGTLAKKNLNFILRQTWMDAMLV